MFTTIRDIIAAIAGAALAFVIVSIYWQGIPLLNDRTELSLPFFGAVKVSSLPIVGPLAVGHLQVKIDEATTLAAASRDQVWEDLRKRMIIQAAAKTALAQARIDEEEQRRIAAEQSRQAATAQLNDILSQKGSGDEQTDTDGDACRNITSDYGRRLRDGLNAVGRGPR